jgi:hypothetical protein
MAFWNVMLNIVDPRYHLLYLSLGAFFSLSLLFLAPGPVRKKLRILTGVSFVLFVLASVGLWISVVSVYSDDLSVWDLFKQDVNVVATYELPDGAEVFVLDEVSRNFSYGRYLMYKKGDKEHLFLIEHAADKFWPSHCTFKFSEGVLYVLDDKDLECRFDTRKIELLRPYATRGTIYTVAPRMESFIHRDMADVPPESPPPTFAGLAQLIQTD